MDDDEIERRKQLTFEQAEGIVPLPAQFQGDDLTPQFRNRLWAQLYLLIEALRDSDYYGHWFKEPLNGMLGREQHHRRHIAIDEVKTGMRSESSMRSTVEGYKYYVLHENPKLVLGLFQWLMRDPECPAHFIKSVAAVFDDLPGTYSLIVDPPTLIPTVTPEERQALGDALEVVSASGFKGARSHLATASGALGDGEWRAAIRESIHAVESAASQIAGKKTTLAGALKLINKSSGLHPALHQAFDKLYGYTNDEQGVRHASIDEDDQSVGEAEALFMFGACASFVGYLSRKYQLGS